MRKKHWLRKFAKTYDKELELWVNVIVITCFLTSILLSVSLIKTNVVLYLFLVICIMRCVLLYVLVVSKDSGRTLIARKSWWAI